MGVMLEGMKFHGGPLSRNQLGVPSHWLDCPLPGGWAWWVVDGRGGTRRANEGAY